MILLNGSSDEILLVEEPLGFATVWLGSLTGCPSVDANISFLNSLILLATLVLIIPCLSS